MGILKESSREERIVSAVCDCCGDKIKLNMFGDLPDHVTIGGYRDGLMLSAIVCIDCMDTKLNTINITKRKSTIGYC